MIKNVCEAERSSRRKVLIVDDEPILRDLLVNMLLVLGYQSESFSCGEMALDNLRSNGKHFGLALVDMHMPGISGVETCKRIRQTHPEMIILLVSGITEDELETFRGDGTVDGFIHKPFSMISLKEIVEKSFAEISDVVKSLVY